MNSGNHARERIPWWAWVVGLALLALGTSVIAAGSSIDGLDGYDRSIFVNVGTAVALVGPLFLAERALSYRIKAVGARATSAQTSAEAAQSAAEGAQSSIDELRRQFQDGLAKARADDAELRGQAAAGSFDDLIELYRKASEYRSIDRLGLRVLVGDPDVWIRVRAIERAPAGERLWLIELTYEDPGLRQLGSTVIWSPGETAADVFLRLATELQRAGRWPGDAAFDPAAQLATIAADLEHVIAIRTGPRGDREVRQIIEVVNDEWAVTREGLDSLTSSAMWAEANELAGDSHLAFRRLESQAETIGANPEKFRIAFGTAEQIHRALRHYNPDD